jgi:hypothetical protein
VEGTPLIWIGPSSATEAQFNASLKGEVSPEQAVETLQSNLQQFAEEGQAVR